MKRLGAAAALAAVLWGPAARAEVYAGANLLLSEYSKYEDVHRGKGNKLFLGYHFATLPMMVEAAQVDFGEPRLDDFSAPPYTFTDSKLGWTGNTFQIGWFGGQPERWAAWAKGGFYSGTSTFDGQVNGSPFSAEEHSSGLCWGLGIEWAFSRYVGLQFDLEGMARVKSLPNTDEQSTVTLYNVGLVGHFGAVPDYAAGSRAREPEPAPRAPIPASPQALPPPYPLQPPAPPLQPSAPAAAVGDTRLLPTGTLLRERPDASAPGAALPVDTEVRLVSRWEKPDGAWWIVEFSGARAWILEKDLP